MDTLFSHVNVVTMNEQMTLWQDAFVGVTDGKIAYMAKKPPEEKPKKIIDATGMVLMRASSTATRICPCTCCAAMPTI